MTETCICWWCEEPGTVEMELVNCCAGDRRARFCEKDAVEFARAGWQRVTPGLRTNFGTSGEQLALPVG